MAGSFAFPGAKGIEAEFPEKVKWVGRLPLNEGLGFDRAPGIYLLF
jgi:hypothetical protein